MAILSFGNFLAALTAGAIGAAVAGALLSGYLDDNTLEIRGLEGPRGLASLPDSSLLISDTSAGRLLKANLKGDSSIIASGIPHTLGGPNGKQPIGPSAAVQVNGTYYYVVGEFRSMGYSTLYRLNPGDNPVALAGGIGPDGFPSTLITNPFDLLASREGQGEFFISDSGRNAVLRVNEEGGVFEYAVFPRREVPDSDGRLMDVVPTGMTYGPDGSLYVASLTGFPYPKGLAYVYRLEDTNGDGDALDEGEVNIYAKGFSAATDLAFEDDGTLIVSEFSEEMNHLVTELGIDRATEAPGRLVRWRDGNIEVVAEGLVSPTAIAVIDGRILVSEEFAGRITDVSSFGRSRLVFPVSSGVGLAITLIAGIGLALWNRIWRG